MENYYEVKKKLFQAIQSPSKKPVAVINIDDAYGERLFNESDLVVKLSYGLKDEATIRASDIKMTRKGMNFAVNLPETKFDCELGLIGRHNIYNALAATGVSYALKVPTDIIQRAFLTLPPVPGRLEIINVGQPFKIGRASCRERVLRLV